MRGAYGGFGDKIIMSLVMDSNICFPTRCCNSLEQKITFSNIVPFFRWILSKFVRFLLEGIFEFWTSSPTIKGAIFKPDVILAYLHNNVSYIASQTYTSNYRYIDSPPNIYHMVLNAPYPLKKNQNYVKLLYNNIAVL